MKLLFPVILILLLISGCKEAAMPLHTRYAGHYSACKPVSSTSSGNSNLTRFITQQKPVDSLRPVRHIHVEFCNGL